MQTIYKQHNEDGKKIEEKQTDTVNERASEREGEHNANDTMTQDKQLKHDYLEHF